MGHPNSFSITLREGQSPCSTSHSRLHLPDPIWLHQPRYDFLAGKTHAVRCTCRGPKAAHRPSRHSLRGKPIQLSGARLGIPHTRRCRRQATHIDTRQHTPTHAGTHAAAPRFNKRDRHLSAASRLSGWDYIVDGPYFSSCWRSPETC